MANFDRRLERLEGDLGGGGDVVVMVGGDFDLAAPETLAELGIQPGRKITVIRTNGPDRFMGVAHCSLPELLRRIDGNTRDILSGRVP